MQEMMADELPLHWLAVMEYGYKNRITSLRSQMMQNETFLTISNHVNFVVSK